MQVALPRGGLVNHGLERLVDARQTSVDDQRAFDGVQALIVGDTKRSNAIET